MSFNCSLTNFNLIILHSSYFFFSISNFQYLLEYSTPVLLNSDTMRRRWTTTADRNPLRERDRRDRDRELQTCCTGTGWMVVCRRAYEPLYTQQHSLALPREARRKIQLKPTSHSRQMTRCFLIFGLILTISVTTYCFVIRVPIVYNIIYRVIH